MLDFLKGIIDGKSGFLNEWRNSTFGNGSFEFRDLLATPQHVYGTMKNNFSQQNLVGSSSATGSTSDAPSLDGLSIFDTFGDTIRDLQADAAARPGSLSDKFRCKGYEVFCRRSSEES